MNCDHVFDILTQGPFPTGNRNDCNVERHLACCYECRQMAEALRPAIDLFHESITEMDQGELPEYRGRIGNASVANLPALIDACIEVPRAQKTAELSLGRRSQSFLRHQTTSIVAATLLIVTAIVVAIAAMPTSEAVSNGVNSGDQTSDNGRFERPTAFSLAQLSKACFKQDGPGLSGATPTASSKALSHDVRCCTLCHNAANPNHPRIDSVAVLEKSCSGCHSH